MTDVNQNAPGSAGGEGQNGAAPQPGEKTDPALLLKSLQETRDQKRDAEAREQAAITAQKLAEDKLAALQHEIASGDPSSAEGKVLQDKVSNLESEMDTMRQDKIFGDLQVKYPVLKDNLDKFKEFKKAYPTGNDESVLKVFLAENNLLGAQPPRKGLEPPTGGPRNPTNPQMTTDEITNLRVTNFRKYSQLVREGKITPDML